MASRRQLKAAREFFSQVEIEFSDLRIRKSDSKKMQMRKTNLSILRRIKLFEEAGFAKLFPEQKNAMRQLYLDVLRDTDTFDVLRGTI
jgi:hypothetical protein